MHSAEVYREMVARLEDEAQRAPGAYKFRLALLGLLGYGVLGVSILVAVAFTAGLLAVIALTNSWVLAAKFFKFLLVPLGLAWVILRALLVRIPPPEGVRLARGQASALEEEVERLRRAAGAPRLSGIIIDSELNAAAVSVPRLLGFFGNRHYLVLGLPLMHLLTRQQLAAVIAHEFGHFGGGHGRFAGWIYRVRESWFRLLQALTERRALASRLYVRFFDWYAPYFNAYSFVLARANEYEADAVAAAVTGKEAAGEALLRISLGAERLYQDFWPVVERKNKEQVEPPKDLYRLMARFLNSDDSDDGSRLERVLGYTPDFHDTHPALSQRLAALGLEPGVPAAPEISAADALLGKLGSALEKRFSDEWVVRVEAAWRENFQAAQQARERLAELDMSLQAGSLKAEEAVEHACLVADLRTGADAMPMLEAALEQSPDHAYGQFRLGELRLERKDDRGVDNLRRAMALDWQGAETVLHRLGAHFHAAGDQSALAGVHEELDRFYEAQSVSFAEREQLGRGDVFLPHDIEREQLDQLKSALDEIGTVSRLWLVRKQLADARGEPHFVGLVKWRGLVLNESRRLDKLAEIFPVPGTFILITPSFEGATRRRIRKAAVHPVYRH